MLKEIEGKAYFLFPRAPLCLYSLGLRLWSGWEGGNLFERSLYV